ncbi:MAG: hypothetical protein A2Z57_12090 [Planctomycetes bacterium RIFCSPHIGHO2_12_39_6]|nr:MAG: hypothetical protein A2Z57_12090 [Planctomycetes bacterium RIFCSPHIGHO2_12_39_6]
MKTIDGHTIDETLLTGGVVIDIGCRGFAFEKEFEKCQVYSIDADESAVPYKYRYNLQTRKAIFNLAITPNDGTTTYYKLGESGYTKDIKEFTPEEGIIVESMKLNTFYEINILPFEEVDILKLDIEGGEYSILADPNFRPLPKQITVEFHDHVFPELHKEMYPKVLSNLKDLGYDLVYQRPDAPLMDCLFIRR